MIWLIFSSSALNGDVPNRVWTRKDVSYDHLRVLNAKQLSPLSLVKPHFRGSTRECHHSNRYSTNENIMLSDEEELETY